MTKKVISLLHHNILTHGYYSFINTPLQFRCVTEISIIFYHNSTQHTAPEVKRNAVPQCCSWYRDGNSSTVTHHNVDAVGYIKKALESKVGALSYMLHLTLLTHFHFVTQCLLTLCCMLLYYKRALILKSQMYH